jgi:hypothetical protein
MEQLAIGTAKYKGNNPKLIEKFGYKETTLYNSEGDYVLDEGGNQYMTDSYNWILNRNPIVSKII